MQKFWLDTPKVARLLVEQGHTQESLALELPMDEGQLGAACRGRRQLTRRRVKRLADALGQKPEDIVRDTPGPYVKGAYRLLPRAHELMKEREWSIMDLAKQSGLASPNLRRLFGVKVSTFGRITRAGLEKAFRRPWREWCEVVVVPAAPPAARTRMALDGADPVLRIDIPGLERRLNRDDVTVDELVLWRRLLRTCERVEPMTSWAEHVAVVENAASRQPDASRCQL